MQSKRFDTAEVAVIPTLVGINTLVLENTADHRVNFHGIRYKGRINGSSTANQLQNGYVTLLCVPNDQIALSGIFNNADMDSWNEMIIAIVPWMILNGATNTAGFGSTFDFEIAPKTSRTCSKGGKIVAQVTNEGLGSVQVNALLTLFTTTV